VIVRATSTPEYWGESFTLTNDDREFLLNLFLEDEQPRTTDELARRLIEYRVQREETSVRRKRQAQGTLYQPKRSFQVGEQIVFPILDFVIGQVTAIRDGHNPDFGPFKVIQVNMDGGGVREFAAEFNYDHRLNEDAAVLFPTEQPISLEELHARYHTTFVPILRTALQASPDFIWLAGKWFPRALLAEVNIGQLNIAEAILDMNGGGPLPTEALLAEVGLPAEINRNLQVFSLNYALFNDERFDEVGPAGEVLWYLVRLEPPNVVTPPNCLLYTAQGYRRDRLTPDLVKIERSLDDEHSELPAADDSDDELTLTLTFPHRRSGTVPLSPTIARLFPTGRTHRIRFMFEDARTGQRWPGWVVRERLYAFGLDTWYQANDVPAGAYVQLQRSDEPGVVVVDLQGHRLRREWVRVAVPRDNRLTFEMLKRAIPCNYDDQMIVVVDDPNSVDKVSTYAADHHIALNELIEQLLPELAKLSPQGNVHVKTLYAAINLIKRTPPGPLFAALMSQTGFRALGDGYWLAR
jgi:hypothetical protein